jgi:hypothetical protein
MVKQIVTGLTLLAVLPISPIVFGIIALVSSLP